MSTPPLAPSQVNDLLADASRIRGIDFRDYQRETVERGIRTRLCARGLADVDAYRRLIASEGAEVDRLIAAVTVPFTQLFRDREVFDALRRNVVPALVQEARREGRMVRAWSVGVASGEEAWSVAMLLDEAGQGSDHEFDVLGTDIGEQPLALARRGLFSEVAAGAIPDDLVAAYLDPAGPDRAVAARLRQRVRFAQHDLLGPALAPPSAVVASFDFVFLRNVLIYFDHRLQDKALERAHSALRFGGVLVLGAVDPTPSPALAGLEAHPGLDPRLRIFRRSRSAGE